MKRKIVCSVAALLAGAGFAAAQDIQLASGSMSQGMVASRMGSCNTCGDASCSMTSCAANCGFEGRFYGNVEYLLWKLGDSFSSTGGSFLPELRSPMPFGAATIANDQFGLVFFSPLLSSNNKINDIDFSGARVTLGGNMSREWGGELTYFQLERREAGFIGAASTQINGFSDGINTFNPFVNVAVEGLGSRRLWGIEANAKHHGVTIGQLRISELVGLRYLDLEQRQTLNQAAQFVDAPGEAFLVGANISTYNGDYRSMNQFYGFTVGLRGEVDFGHVFTSLTGKFSAGGVRMSSRSLEEVNTTSTLNNIPGTIFPGPVENSDERTRLAYVLEGTWNAGIRVTDNLSVYAGYNVLILNRAATPLDHNSPIGGTGAVSLAPPALIAPLLNVFEETRFVAFGLNVGLEFKY